VELLRSIGSLADLALERCDLLQRGPLARISFEKDQMAPALVWSRCRLHAECRADDGPASSVVGSDKISQDSAK
jgi:hypothetical protein